MQSFDNIWEMVLKSLSEKFAETTMNLWFNHLELAALSDTTAVLISDNNFVAGITIKNYKETLTEHFTTILGFPVEVIILSSEDKTIDRTRLQQDVIKGLPITPFTAANPANQEKQEEPTATPLTQTSAESPSPPQKNTSTSNETLEKTENAPSSDETEVKYFSTAGKPDTENIQSLSSGIFFNSEYTFENFIVGSSNKFAHAACIAVANNPASGYNPLFIYGPSGLGKTHLLYAITNRIREKTPNANIVYVKGETFTNQLIEAISTETTAKFREKYRQADVFLIDDVQFIAGKVSTQEEFFNTFNELYEAKKQIILTSDRPPKEIKTLEERVKTRFEWGLIVDIQPPDLELRIAILRKKAQFMDVDIPIEVLNYLAEKLKSNIRQIEGAIKRLGAYSSLTNQPITIEMARENIADVTTGIEPVKVTQDKIFNAVAHKYGVTVDEIKGTRRTREIAMARHVSIYIMRNVTGMSLPSIGKVFHRDHTTILSSIETIQKKIRDDASVENDIDDLTKEITNQ